MGTYLCGRNKNKLNPFTVGAWNVRTLIDHNDTDRPHRRTALVSRELDRFNIDIAALSETRLAGEGSLTEAGANYTFFWKGKDAEDRRIHGIGFAIKSSLVNHYNLAPTAINERLMTLRVPLPDNNHLTLISVSAPTLDSEEDLKGSFYTALNSTIQAVPSRDKLLVLGDFNARVGRDHRVWKGILGKQGLGSCNSNGLLLLGLCAENELTITNTLFRLPNRHKTTWKHPRSKHWTILDYILTRSLDRNDVLVTRSMPGADDFWTDHRLLTSRLRIRLRNLSRHNRPKRARRFNVARMKIPAVQEEYSIRLTELLSEAPPPAPQQIGPFSVAPSTRLQRT